MNPAKNQLNRRRFFHSTAALGGGLILSANAVSQENQLNIGLIGCGTQGQKLLAVCMKIPGIQVKAVCDIWENFTLTRASRILTRFKQEHNTYTDYKEMLAKETDLDAVIIATPDAFHAEQTAACLNAGIHVYCESMMANTLEGAKKMIKAAKVSGKLLQIGHQRRSNPYYQYAFNHIIHETRLLGQITAINGQWNRPKQPARGWPRRAPVPETALTQYGFESMDQFRNWSWYKQFGSGPLGELGSHQIDIFNWYLGALPQGVTASGGVDYYHDESYNCHDTAMAILDYPNGESMVRALYQTINMNSNFGYFENFMGDVGTLYVSESPGRVKVYREPEAPDWTKWVRLGILSEVEKEEAEQKEETTEDSTEMVLDVQQSILPPEYNLPVKLNESIFQPHLTNFFNAIKGQEPLNCPAESAYATTVCILKIIEAIDKGQRLELSQADFQV